VLSGWGILHEWVWSLCFGGVWDGYYEFMNGWVWVGLGIGALFKLPLGVRTLARDLGSAVVELGVLVSF